MTASAVTGVGGRGGLPDNSTLVGGRCSGAADQSVYDQKLRRTLIDHSRGRPGWPITKLNGAAWRNLFR